MSTPAPGGNGTMIRTGFVGYVCAPAAVQVSAAIARTAALKDGMTNDPSNAARCVLLIMA
jgi:hypothetical protein